MQYFVRNRRRLKTPTAATPPVATSPVVPLVPVEQDEPVIIRERSIVSG